MAETRAFSNWVLIIFLLAVAGAALAVPVCNIDSSELNQCLPAVSGSPPAPPSSACCGVVKRVSMPCLCSYKSYLPVFGIDPALAFALPKKCGMKTKPPCVA